MEENKIDLNDSQFEFVVFYNKILNDNNNKIKKLLVTCLFLLLILSISIGFNFILLISNL